MLIWLNQVDDEFLTQSDVWHFHSKSCTALTFLLKKSEQSFIATKQNFKKWVKNEFSEHTGKGGSISIAITHHLDVGVLSQQAVIGHGLKGEMSSGQIRHSLSLTMLTRTQELVLRSWCITSKATCVCVCVWARACVCVDVCERVCSSQGF